MLFKSLCRSSFAGIKSAENLFSFFHQNKHLLNLEELSKLIGRAQELQIKSTDSQLIGIVREQTARLRTFAEQVPVGSLPRYLELTSLRLLRFSRFGGRAMAAEPSADLAKLFQQCSAELSHGQLLTIIRYLQVCGSLDAETLNRSIERLAIAVPDMNMYQLIQFVEVVELQKSSWAALQAATARLAEIDFSNISKNSALEILSIFSRNSNFSVSKKIAAKKLFPVAMAGELTAWAKVALLKCMRDLSHFQAVDAVTLSDLASSAGAELCNSKLQPRVLADFVTVCTAMLLEPAELESAVDLVARNIPSLEMKQMLDLLWEQLASENNHSNLIYGLVTRMTNPDKEGLIVHAACKSLASMRKLVEINAALQIDQRLSELPRFGNGAILNFEEKQSSRVFENKSFSELQSAVDSLVDPHFFPQGLKAAPATFYGMNIPLYSKRHRLVIDFDCSFNSPSFKLRRLLFKHLKLKLLVVTDRHWRKLSSEGKQETWLRDQILATVRGSGFKKI